MRGKAYGCHVRLGPLEKPWEFRGCCLFPVQGCRGSSRRSSHFIECRLANSIVFPISEGNDLEYEHAHDYDSAYVSQTYRLSPQSALPVSRRHFPVGVS